MIKALSSPTMHRTLWNFQWLSYRHEDVFTKCVTVLQEEANILWTTHSKTRCVPCVSMFWFIPWTNRTNHPVHEPIFLGHPAHSPVVISTELSRLTVVSIYSLPHHSATDRTETSTLRWLQQQPSGFFAGGYSYCCVSGTPASTAMGITCTGLYSSLQKNLRTGFIWTGLVFAYFSLHLFVTKLRQSCQGKMRE
jgi:hypothetical protein